MPSRVLTPEERHSLDDQLAELRAAEREKSWKSLSFLSGQLVEALLAKKIRLSAPDADLSKVHGIGGLVQLAFQHKVFTRQGILRSSEAVLESARIVRNWSAHYSFALRHPTELNATQTLALLVCATESLFRDATPRAAPPTREPYASIIREIVKLKAPEQLPRKVLDNLDIAELFRHAAQGSMSHLSEVSRVLRQHGVDTTKYGDVVAAQFGGMVRRASATNWRTLQNFYITLKRFGLRDEARVFSILLPLDSSFLSYLLTNKSVAEVRAYLQQARAGDRGLFLVRLSRSEISEQAIATFWSRVRDRPSATRGALQIVRFMPLRTVAKFMAVADADLLDTWLRSQPLRRTTFVWRLLSDRVVSTDRRVEVVRDRLYAAPLSAIASADLVDLSTLPNALHRAELALSPAGVTMLAALVDRTSTLLAVNRAVCAPVRRILWDVFAFCPPLESDALTLAVQALGVTASGPTWDSLCVQGLVALAAPMMAPAMPAFDIPDPAEFTPPLADRWQFYLAMLGLWQVSRDKSSKLYQHLRARLLLLDPPRLSSRKGRSAELVEAVARVIAA